MCASVDAARICNWAHITTAIVVLVKLAQHLRYTCKLLFGAVKVIVH